MISLLGDMSSWIDKNKRGEKWYVFTGRAYPRVVQGSNKTTRITSDMTNRDAFYNDPAVVLSDNDLNRFNGAEGKPLWVEHVEGSQVGHVQHSWLSEGDGDKRSLKIIGRVCMETPYGRQVVADIKAKKYKGLSVGYGTDLVSNHHTGATELWDKNFREISLVKDPFFDGCHLAEFGVTATKIPNHNNPGPNSSLLLRIDASKEIIMETNNNTQEPVSGNELLEEASKLKNQLSEETKAKETQAQELAKMKSELEELRALKNRVAEKEKAEADAYAASQLPKFEAYVQELVASKIPVTEEMKQDLKMTFCHPKMKDGARHLEAEYAHKVEMRASLKVAEDRAKAAEEAQKRLEQTMSKTTQILNHSRSEFAAALGSKDVKEDEARRNVAISDSLTSTDVNASGSSDLNRVMMAEPSLEDMPFLQVYGFSASSTGVNASSSFGFGSSRQLVRSMPVAATHSHMRNEEGELVNPESARFCQIPNNRAMFGWMYRNRELADGDLSDVARMREDKNTLQRKDPVFHAPIQQQQQSIH